MGVKISLATLTAYDPTASLPIAVPGDSTARRVLASSLNPLGGVSLNAYGIVYSTPSGYVLTNAGAPYQTLTTSISGVPMWSNISPVIPGNGTAPFL